MPRDTITTILNRRSIRRYKSEPIPEADIRTILEAGRQAPSGGNRQPWHFVVVRDRDIKQALGVACNNQTWIADADLVIAAIGLPEVSPKWFIIDPTIALANIILAATSLGYGTCWIGAFDEAKVKEVLEIPKDLRVVCLTPVGIPDESPPARPRKSMEEIYSFNTFGNPLKADMLI